jgi:hypothetical protein
MRLMVSCLLFGVAVAEIGLAPNSERLLKLYGTASKEWRNWDGNPDSQSFTVPPQINLSVLYGSDHYACRITLEPQSLNQTDPSPEYMPSGRVSEILEEVAPSAKRGKSTGNNGIFWAGCQGMQIQNYEGVLITRTLVCSSSRRYSEKSAQVNFKRDVCPKADGQH